MTELQEPREGQSICIESKRWRKQPLSAADTERYSEVCQPGAQVAGEHLIVLVSDDHGNQDAIYFFGPQPGDVPHEHFDGEAQFVEHKPLAALEDRAMGGRTHQDFVAECLNETRKRAVELPMEHGLRNPNRRFH